MSVKKDLDINSPVEAVPFVGSKGAVLLSKLGIETVSDLLTYKPRGIVDLTDKTNIIDLQEMRDQRVVVDAEIVSCSLGKTAKKRMWIVDAKIADDTGEIRVVWYNQPYLKKILEPGKRVIIRGLVGFDFSVKKVTILSPEIFFEKGIFPIYRLTKNVTSKQILRAVKNALQSGYRFEEFLPKEILDKFDIPEINDAVKMLHFPNQKSEFDIAKKRFNFADLLVFVLANLYQREKNKKLNSFKIKWPEEQVNNFIKNLPFQLTKDQVSVTSDISKDLEKQNPMSRLIQGDVGSGKTVVGMIASLAVSKNGYRTTWLAPTEILAKQHYDSAKKFFEGINFEVELVTAQTKIKNKKINYDADLIIGTHALLQADVNIDNLALVIIDEQHRFGVNQRSLLIEQNSRQPHFLSLSATPIPRTLSHVVFGNLDVSIIKTKPKNRLPVKTYAIANAKREDTYKFIDSLIGAGQQAFFVCPLIEEIEPEDSDQLFEDPAMERKTVDNEIENLSKTVLGQRRLGKIHGKMKSQDKQDIMLKMRNGEIDVLVATSVIEVGVDIPMASVMVIEDADRFGLSQLHQFRGRVGRNDIQSYCFLFSTKLAEERTKERLSAFVRNLDGFELSMIDLKQRGPGAILGLDQSGFKGFNPLWFEDTKILDDAMSAAKKILPNLNKLPKLSQKVESQFQTDHLE